MQRALTVRYTPNGASGELEVDGKDLSGAVERVSIDHRAGELPKVFLELSPRAEVAEVMVEGMVHVRETVMEDPADACLRFLEPIDAAEFERACLEAMELGGAHTFGQAALAVLRAWASGK